jgi:hypothetical protein
LRTHLFDEQDEDDYMICGGGADDTKQSDECSIADTA